MREKEHLESQGGVVSLHLEWSLERLKQLAGAGHRLEQPAVGNHFQEGEETAQPRQLCGALSADKIYAVDSSGKHVYSWNVHQTFGESSL